MCTYIDASADPDKARPSPSTPRPTTPARVDVRRRRCSDVAPSPKSQTNRRAAGGDLRAAGVSSSAGRAPPRLEVRHHAAALAHEGELAIAVETVSGVDAAIDGIVNAHGSWHTGVVVAEESVRRRGFMSRVDSADVFHSLESRRPPAAVTLGGRNSEARNSDERCAIRPDARLLPRSRAASPTASASGSAPRRDLDGRIHARGPVGVEGLLTTRNRLTRPTATHAVGGDFAQAGEPSARTRT